MQVEAGSALNGVGHVRLMGRSSGFITMEASMASGAWLAHSTTQITRILF